MSPQPPRGGESRVKAASVGNRRARRCRATVSATPRACEPDVSDSDAHIVQSVRALLEKIESKVELLQTEVQELKVLLAHTDVTQMMRRISEIESDVDALKYRLAHDAGRQAGLALAGAAAGTLVTLIVGSLGFFFGG